MADCVHPPAPAKAYFTGRGRLLARRFGKWPSGVACLLVVLGAGRPAPQARAEEGASARLTRLNKQALDAFDNLNFDQAKSLLEQALTQAQSADLGNDAATARTHLNLGMVLIAGFQQRDPAIEHFKAALAIQPDIVAPAGLFNPEVQAAFDEAKAGMKARPEAARPAERPPRPPAATAAPATSANQGAKTEAETTGDDEEEAVARPDGRGKFLLSVGLGSGLGVAKGHLDANRDLDSNGDGIPDNTWSGGIAPSRLGHLMLGVGYFVSPDILISAEGRLQIITGTTEVKGAAGSSVCVPSCAAPSTAVAVFAKARWYLSQGRLRPFLDGGIGAGSIRQVVKLNIGQAAGTAAPVTGCGQSRMDPCVDTVTGGPFWMTAGGGLSYQLGAVDLLGSLTAAVGVPDFMLNVDALFGLGFRL